MARAGTGNGSAVEYRCCDFGEAGEARHDAVLASNLYHLLGREDRRRLSAAVEDLLKPRGLVFLNAVSERDPNHFGEVTAEPRHAGGRRHTVTPSSEDELRHAFGSLEVKDLYEHEYMEPHAAGEAHHAAGRDGSAAECSVFVGQDTRASASCRSSGSASSRPKPALLSHLLTLRRGPPGPAVAHAPPGR